MLTELLFNMFVDWLSPLEYDGRAHVKLPDSDPRLAIGQLLQWELGNAAAAISVLCDRVLVPLNGLLARSDARDKAARLVQYALRTVVGVLAVLQPSEARRRLVQTLGRLMLTLSSARRTHRWLRLAPLLALRRQSALWEEPLWAPRALALGSKLATLGFLGYDHVRWLQEHGLVRGAARESGVTSMRFGTLAHSCNLTIALLHASASSAPTVRGQWGWLQRRRSASARELAEGEAAEGEAAADEAAADEARAASLREAGLQLMYMLQSAHEGKVPLLQSNDTAVGLMGVLSSALALQRMWPRVETC